MANGRMLLVAWLAISMGIVGCRSAESAVSPPPAAPADSSIYPPDFALVFHVQARGEVESRHPMERSAQHVVEPSRVLRVALGRGTSIDTYPPPTARLTHDDMANLHRLADAAGLTRQATHAEPSSEVEWVYEVRVTAEGRTYAHRFERDANPAAGELLNALVGLRRGQPVEMISEEEAGDS